MPPPNIFLSRLFSKTRLKRKDFQKIALLAWAQEVPSSNLGAPTTYFFILNSQLQRSSALETELGSNLDPNISFSTVLTALPLAPDLACPIGQLIAGRRAMRCAMARTLWSLYQNCSSNQ
jgi:hypothetical protein